MSRAVRALWDIAEACISRGIQAGTPTICKCTVAIGLNTAVVKVGSVTLWTEGVQTPAKPIGMQVILVWCVSCANIAAVSGLLY